MVVYKHFCSPFLLQLIVIHVLFITSDFCMQFQIQHIFSIQMVNDMYQCNHNQWVKKEQENNKPI